MEVKKKTVEVSTYIASDGTEFDDEYRCKLHEESLEIDRLEDEVHKYPAFPYSPPFYMYGLKWEWIFISNEEEFIKAHEVVLYIHEKPKKAPAYNFPCWICFSHDDEGYGVCEGTYEDVLEKLQSFSERLPVIHDHTMNNFIK